MFSLLHVPFVILDLILSYVYGKTDTTNTTPRLIQSKYSKRKSDNFEAHHQVKKSKHGSKGDSNNADSSSDTADNSDPTVDIKTIDDERSEGFDFSQEQVTGGFNPKLDDHVEVVDERAIKQSLSKSVEMVPQETQHVKSPRSEQQVLIALSESDDSDYENYVVSVTPSHIAPSYTTPSHVAPSYTTPSPDTKPTCHSTDLSEQVPEISSTQNIENIGDNNMEVPWPAVVMDNAHVEIVDEEFRPGSYERSPGIMFSNEAGRDSESSMSTPDTDLPSYNADLAASNPQLYNSNTALNNSNTALNLELDTKENIIPSNGITVSAKEADLDNEEETEEDWDKETDQDKTAPNSFVALARDDVDVYSNHPAGAISARQYSRSPDSDVDVNDEPVPTESLTSSKNAPIKKYVPKERMKKKKSDLEWNQYMEKCMLAGQRSKILNNLRACFKEAFDAYRLCCDLIITFGVTHASGRTIFQRAAISEIALWKQDHDYVRAALSSQIKALDVSYLCNTTLFKPLSEVYEFGSVPAEDVVIFINDKLEHKPMKYIKHMAFIVSELKLQEYFDTPEILLPLLSMDKLMTIEAYLSDANIASHFVRALDELLEPDGCKLTALVYKLELDYEYTVSTAQFKFTTDQLTTLIKRLSKMYNLPATVFPVLAQYKTINNIKSLLYCKYVKGTTEDWTSMIIDTVKDSDVLQKALFAEIVKYKDLDYAAHLTDRLKPKEELIPEQISSYINTNQQSEPAPSPTNRHTFGVVDNADWHDIIPKTQSQPSEVIRPKSPTVDPVTNYLEIPKAVSICEVNTPTSLKICQDILASAPVIGLDSEWCALIDPTKTAPVALLQLSCHNTAFLLDIPYLLDSVPDTDLTAFARSVFNEQLIVGYGLTQDFIKMRETCPIIGGALSAHAHVLDLSVPHKHLTKMERAKRSNEIRTAISEGKPLPEPTYISQHTGLSRLSEMVLAAPMDKTHQISDWKRRPLSAPQKMYAALDAYILLPLYYKLTDMFHPTLLTDLTLVTEDVVEERGGIVFIPAASQPTDAASLRVLVDVMCQGLGKKLRHIGIDCVILDEHQTVDDAAKISLAEGRIIFSKDGNCEKLVRLTDPGRVYQVKSSTAAEQLAEIRTHFNLVVAPEDLFSRCAICNCGYFVKLDPDQAKDLKISQAQYNSSTVDFPAEVFERRRNFVEKITVSTAGFTQYGVKLQLDKVNINKFSEDKVFWGCYDCGKMYWDGCHLKNFIDKHNL